MQQVTGFTASAYSSSITCWEFKAH